MINKIKNYLYKRNLKKKHLDFLRTVIIDDVRWFAAVTGAKEITERYELLTRDDWYCYDVKNQNVLRDELKLKQQHMDVTKLNLDLVLLKKDKEQLQKKISSLYSKLRKCQKSHDVYNRN